MIKKISLFVYLLGWLFLLFSISVFIFFFRIQYEQFVQKILQEIHREDLYLIITTSYFSVKKFIFLKKVSILFSFFSFLFSLIYFKKRKFILLKIEIVLEDIQNSIFYFVKFLFGNEKPVNILLLLAFMIILLRSIFYANSFYIQYDEAWNYNYFLRYNPFYTLFAYNNYPLHNLVSNFILFLFPTSTFVLRVPSILFGLSTFLLVFVVLKKIFSNSYFALCGATIFSFLPMSVFYMLYARGVMLEMFFAFLLIYFLHKYFTNEISFKQIVYLSFINMLGTYSMLSHVYFIGFTFVSILIYLVFYDISKIKFSFYYLLFSILFSAILMLPFFIGTGISLGFNAAIHSNQLIELHILPYHAYSDMISGAWFLFYVFILLNFSFLYFNKEKKYQWLIVNNIILLLSPLLIYLITKTFPPERALGFLIIVPVFTCVLLMKQLEQYKYLIYLLTMMSLPILTWSVYHHPKMNWSKNLDREAYSMCQLFDRYHIKKVYSTSNTFKYYVPALIYYFSLKNQQFYYTTNDRASARYQENADKETQCLITEAPLSNVEKIYEFDGMYFYIQGKEKTLP